LPLKIEGMERSLQFRHCEERVFERRGNLLLRRNIDATKRLPRFARNDGGGLVLDEYHSFCFLSRSRVTHPVSRDNVVTL